MPADFSYDDAVRRYGKNNVEKCEAAHQRPGLYRVWVKPDCRYRQSKMPFSEVNMHMHIAGMPMDFEVIPSEHGYAPSVQLYEPDTDVKFSSPITCGEAGIYYTASKFKQRHDWHVGGYYYFYPDYSGACS